jgi:hypothetical protein
MTSQDPWRSRKGRSAAHTDVEAVAGQVNGRAASVRLLEQKDRNQMLALGGEAFLKAYLQDGHAKQARKGGHSVIPGGPPARLPKRITDPRCVRKGLIRRAPSPLIRDVHVSGQVGDGSDHISLLHDSRPHRFADQGITTDRGDSAGIAEGPTGDVSRLVPALRWRARAGVRFRFRAHICGLVPPRSLAGVEEASGSVPRILRSTSLGARAASSRMAFLVRSTLDP